MKKLTREVYKRDFDPMTSCLVGQLADHCTALHILWLKNRSNFNQGRFQNLPLFEFQKKWKKLRFFSVFKVSEWRSFWRRRRWSTSGFSTSWLLPDSIEAGAKKFKSRRICQSAGSSKTGQDSQETWHFILRRSISIEAKEIRLFFHELSPTILAENCFVLKLKCFIFNSLRIRRFAAAL